MSRVLMILMCDTLVALENSTSDGSVILAKNSDREPNEGHGLFFFPGRRHGSGEKVKCTYADVAQVEETYATLLSAPHWMFGCEMGANEYGVAIGNEAVFTKEPERDTGLLGMDMMRLALERSKTATEALETIVSLLETHGQGGVCGFEDKKMKYHNSYLIADLSQAWVLETADKFWIAEEVQDVRTISNCLTVESHYDKIHPGLIDHAVKKGYCSSKSDFNFRKCFTAGILDKRTWGGKGFARHSYTTRALRDLKGGIDVSQMMRILRSHSLRNEPVQESWDPSKGSMASICIHSKPMTVPTQTTSSYVGHLLPELQVHWFTGTAAPCTSLFKPVWTETGLPDLGPAPGSHYDGKSLWWAHERLHRKILEDYSSRIKIIRQDQQDFESRYLKRVLQVQSDIKAGRLSGNRRETLRQVTKEAFEEAEKLESKWLSRIEEQSIQRKPGLFYRRFWDSINRRAMIS
jgi:dipeptidase